ncbi:hypothetical protein H4684_000292 [Desulfomicrobium macestii]|uniref:Uncharacterized protein n=2 Tax=Desulfomicrobium TaxID=898 RepID=A0A8G2C0J7_DESNO|nr:MULTISPECIES: hypothetical protein [Desulfomicrobium]MBE1423671.1 hypothetical protein [Desulfomicrobium macestii]SFL34859.1 hypothetical protein SAMN05421830_101723 [Desulfomicrobium norvegicum]
MQIILHLEAKLHNLTAEPSKAKNTSLARSILVPACLFIFMGQAALAGITIDSGAQKDTVMQTGRAGSDDGSILIHSDPDNGSLILVSPPPAPPQEDSDLEPVIIVPEINIKE